MAKTVNSVLINFNCRQRCELRKCENKNKKLREKKEKQRRNANNSVCQEPSMEMDTSPKTLDVNVNKEVDVETTLIPMGDTPEAMEGSEIQPNASEELEDVQSVQIDDCSTVQKSSFKKTSVKLYKCEVCRKEFSKKAYAKVHCKSKKAWQCDRCGTEIVNVQNIKRHKDRCSKPMKVRAPQNKTDFKCPECDKQFPSKFNLVRHGQAAHGVEEIGELQCTVKDCKFSCNDPKYMKKHMTSIHYDGPSIKCKKCEFECLSKSGLLKHMVTDHGKECQHCDQVCSSEKILKIHMFRVHKEVFHNTGGQVIVVRRKIGEHAHHQSENASRPTISLGLEKELDSDGSDSSEVDD